MVSPKVSVCLTAHERCGVIGATIDSILAQDYSDFELLIQDDASRDATEDVCRAYAARDSRISYRRNPVNLGMPGNLNAVIARARAPLVANLHDGDEYRPDLLAKWVAAIEREQAGFVFNQLEELTNAREHLRFHTHPFGPRLERGELVRYMLERFDSPVWGTVMARKACYEEVGYFDERYGFFSDVAMWMRINLRYPVAYVAEPLIRITPHESTRPHGHVNWALEHAVVAMREEMADRMFRDARATASYVRRLRRARDRRWLRQAGSCLKSGRADLLREGLAVFREDDSVILKWAGIMGLPAVAAASLVARRKG